jgi:signal transduction histidine kinase
LGWWPHPVLVFTTATLAFGSAALIDRAGPGPLATLFDPTVGRAGRIRLILGVALVVAGLAIFASAVGPAFQVPSIVLAIVVTAVGVVVGFGPVVRRLVADLARERNERIRQEERAEVAAHLHDSVLQTLALIQRTDDLSRITMLARHQESELRDWLYGATPLDGLDLMSSALRQAARRVEADHQIPVEVVAVGDHPLDEAGTAMVGAATEAMVNAAKHSGAARISLYFEANDDQVSVYVTDQGKGFDTRSIPNDRRGIVESIIARVRRAGGAATVTSEPGEGTEVHLTMPVSR